MGLLLSKNSLVGVGCGDRHPTHGTVGESPSSAFRGTVDLTNKLCLEEILSILKDILSSFVVTTETGHTETGQCCFWKIIMSFHLSFCQTS